MHFDRRLNSVFLKKIYKDNAVAGQVAGIIWNEGRKIL